MKRFLVFKGIDIRIPCDSILENRRTFLTLLQIFLINILMVIVLNWLKKFISIDAWQNRQWSFSLLKVLAPNFYRVQSLAHQMSDALIFYYLALVGLRDLLLFVLKINWLFVARRGGFGSREVGIVEEGYFAIFLYLFVCFFQDVLVSVVEVIRSVFYW